MRTLTCFLVVLVNLGVVSSAWSNPLDNVTILPDTIRGTDGFFRVGQTPEGRWLFIDPDGKPFVYRGVCGINRAGQQGGRRAVPGPYAEAVDAKYGYQEDPQRFVDATIQRLRDWGFNAMGSWTTEEFFEQGMPYTEILEFQKIEPSITAPGIKLPDVFDPAWVEAIDQWARQICTPRRESRLLVGYFTDNELSWGQPNTDAIWGAPENVNRRGPTLLQACLALPADRAAHRAAWDFVMERHGNSFQRLSQAWGVHINGREDLATMDQPLNTPGYGRDHDDFTRLFTRLYVQHTAEAIRRHDPNHLILGARFGAPPPLPVLDEFKPPFVDVISANNYRVNMYERMDIYYQPNRMPILIGEFSWASPPFVGGRGEGLEERIARTGPASLERTFTHPGIVGYTWYRWVQDPRGPVGYGLVDRADNPVPLNIRLVSEVNARLDDIAAQPPVHPE